MTAAPIPIPVMNGQVAGYGSMAPLYLARGWVPLPIPVGEKKAPPEGYTGRFPDPSAETVQQWIAANPVGNIAVRIPDGVVGIDVDAYAGKTGGSDLENLRA